MPRDVVELLERPNPAVITALRPDGQGGVNAWIEIDRWHGWGALRNVG